MAERINNPAFFRNYGFWGEGEQRALNDATVSIAGVGGDGFQLGLKLAMMGVGRIKVADPEVFEEENGNRVPGATLSNVGRNKAEAFQEAAENLPARPQVEIFTDGINADNVKEFVRGADLVLDESELTHLELGTMLARETRAIGKPQLLVMNVGFAAIATSFKPNPGRNGMTFERLMGIPDDMPLKDVAEQELDLSRCLPYIPPYSDHRTLVAAQNGAPLPSISVGVDFASGIGSSEAFKHLAGNVQKGWPKPIWAPRFRYTDGLGESGVTSHNHVRSHKLRGLYMYTRSLFGVNPKASYTDEERARRIAAFEASQE